MQRNLGFWVFWMVLVNACGAARPGPRGTEYLRSGPWILLGEGTAALVVSAVASVAQQQAAERCPVDETGHRFCGTATVQAEVDRDVAKWGQLALGTGVLGGLSVGSAAVWLPLDVGIRHHRSRVRVAPFPIAQPGGVWGVGLGGRF